MPPGVDFLVMLLLAYVKETEAFWLVVMTMEEFNRQTFSFGNNGLSSHAHALIVETEAVT